MKLFSNELDKAKQIFIPQKLIKKSNANKRSFKPSDNLHEAFKSKREAFKFYKKFPTKTNYSIYCKARNEVKTKVRLAKKQKEISIAKTIKTNPKAFYQYVASKTKTKEGVSNLIKKDGTLTNSDLEKAETLNNFFSSVFTIEDKHNIPEFSLRTDKTIDNVNITTVDEMKKACLL